MNLLKNTSLSCFLVIMFLIGIDLAQDGNVLWMLLGLPMCSVVSYGVEKLGN